MPHAAALATRLAGRPLLMTAGSAEALLRQVRSFDARGAHRPGLFGGIMDRLAGRAPVTAMWDDDDGEVTAEALGDRLAYAPLWMGEPDDYGYGWSLKDGVALINVDTALWDEGFAYWGMFWHGYDTLLRAFREAMADDRVRAIFLRLKSPGGIVAGGLQELGDFMRANRAAAGGKPIHVYAEMACSAAYWIAAQADKIWAPKVGQVGSIGAVLVHENMAGALEKYGIEITAIQFGEHKTDGAWWAALSPAAQANLQAEIDQCGRDFVADTHAGRPGLTPQALTATGAAVFMAKHDDAARSGLDLGFVDEISGEEAAFLALAATVSDPQSTGIDVAQGGLAAASPEKDKTMATPAQIKAARVAALATARANVARLEAETGEDTMPGGEDTATGEDEDETEAAGASGEDAVGETAAIAASAEGKANPALALAAIGAGLTLAQFQATAKVAGTPAKGGKLAAVMESAQRLGADAPAATAAKPLTTAETFERNRQAGLAKRGK